MGWLTPIGRFRLWQIDRAKRRHQRHYGSRTALLDQMGLPWTADNLAYVTAAQRMYRMDRMQAHTTLFNIGILLMNLANTAINALIGSWWLADVSAALGWLVCGLLVTVHNRNLTRWAKARAHFLTLWEGPWPPVVHQ